MAQGNHERLPNNAVNLEKNYTIDGGKSVKVLGKPKKSTIQSKTYSVFPLLHNN